MSRFAICSFLLALTAAASSSTPTTPTTNTPTAITDTYKGTIALNGAERFSFVTAVSGTTSATLTSLTPSDAVVGLGLGSFTSSTGTCDVMLANDKATLGSLLQGQSDRAGNLCVRVYDSTGTLAVPVSYTVQVVHY